MKLAAAGAARYGDDAGRATRRIAAGIALSLALHALVLNLQRDGWRREAAQAPPRPIAVRLRPVPPPAMVAPQAGPTRPVQPAPRATPRSQPKGPRPVIAVKPKPAPAQPDPFTVQQTPQPEAPRFDRDAARRMARSLANMRDPSREGTAVGQFPDKPLETETRAARAIGAARRPACKDGLPGGLLGPLLILADKKDSGCKW